MRKRQSRRALFIFLVMLCGACASRASSGSQNQVCFKTHCIDVEVARKEDELTEGLQFRTVLGENSGMIFIFPKSDAYHFWMKDTVIPLDIIWFDDNQSVIYIAGDVPPCTKDPCLNYGPSQPSRYVLEINAGYAKKINIQTGDQAQFVFSKQGTSSD